MKNITLTITLCLAIGACGSEEPSPIDGIDSIVFLQRPARGGLGDIFDYTSYIAGARLVKLSPPTADGELTVLCCDTQGDEYAEIDISGYDLSFDAREIVFAGRLSQDQKYGLFILSLDSGEVIQLPTDPNQHYLSPVFLPGDRVMYTSTAVVEEGAPQFRDEYERSVTTQLGVINKDGTEDVLGARNLSHRVFPALLSDGRVMLTQWQHLGPMNAGHLVTVNPDMSTLREAFGKERTGVTNSYLKAIEIAPGRVVAIGTARNRTVQSGTILDIRLGEPYEQDGAILADKNMSEKNASYRILTPQVPRDNAPSNLGVGRYYDAYPLNAKDYPDLLVSWSDGPVESGTLAAADLNAEFGIYLYDSQRGLRRPIWDAKEYWDVFPRPLTERDAPPVIQPSGGNDFSDDAVLIGSMNVYESSVDDFADGSIYGVRILEGFSSEEIHQKDFGMTEHEGSAMLGVVPVQADGSWAALIPPNVPIHQQVIDRFGMSLRSEPVWISGNRGESLVCGGCHEDRAKVTVIDPGQREAFVSPDGIPDLLSATTRFERKSTDFSRDKVIGVPWDLALQPVFDAKCVACHDGTPGPANKSYTITDPASGDSLTWTFNLSGKTVAEVLAENPDGATAIGDVLMSSYSASHLSIMGAAVRELEEAGLTIDGEFESYVDPNHARDSKLIQLLNPPVLYPEPDMNTRAFPDMPTHAEAQGFPADLTPDEYHLLILMADSGGQYFARENVPETTD